MGFGKRRFEIYDCLDENLKELMINNLIFDRDDIINRVTLLLYNSNQEIDKNLIIIKEKYTFELGKEIHKYFTK